MPACQMDGCSIIIVIQYSWLSCVLFQSHTVSQYFDFTDGRFYSCVPYPTSKRRRFFVYHHAMTHPHSNIILSLFSISLVLKCAAKILKIGLKIKFYLFAIAYLPTLFPPTQLFFFAFPEHVFCIFFFFFFFFFFLLFECFIFSVNR